MTTSVKSIEVLHHATEMHCAVEALRRNGKTVGLVPTMGALHEGHLSLVKAARRECDVTVVTIFVNPTQFGPGEDFRSYPRTLEADLRQLAQFDVEFVFAPANDEMYAPEHSTYVEPPAVAQPLEGAFRPGHFRGVATVVLKLLNMIPAHVAFFGHKDYQQTLVIRRMVEDLSLAVDIRVCPTIREPGGLAMSSRNQYLSPPQRHQALALWQCLCRAEELVRGGENNADIVRAEMRAVLAIAGIDRVDYTSLADPETLLELKTLDRPAIALVAAHVGKTRLIDNLPLTTSNVHI